MSTDRSPRRALHPLGRSQYPPCLRCQCCASVESGDAAMIFYELWDKKSRNLLGSFETKEEALALAAGILAGDSSSIDHLTLDWGKDDDEDAGGQLAEGAKLSDLLRNTRASQARARRASN